MAGSSALDGGRILKSAALAFGTLIFAAPVAAQPADPLAPLPATPRAQTIVQPSVQPPPAQPVVSQPQAPVSTVPVPRDWRGVFDAIGSGNWASAQAGIAALPPSVLTPVAKAELYTAKGSPVVDLASIQALIAQAPELPEANQLGLMAIKRGATTAPLVIAEKPSYDLGAAPVRYRAHPVTGEPAEI